jgi:hypothetical protein
MSRLKSVVVLAVALLWVGGVVAAQTTPALKIQNTDQFFSWFLRLKERAPAKTEFETEDAYRKRLPAIDSRKIVYFMVEPERSVKSYSYDPATQTLILGAGILTDGEGRTAPFWDEGTTATGMPFQRGVRLARRGVVTGSYVGETAFGVRRRVSQSVRTDYILRLSVPREWWGTHVRTSPLFPPQLAFDLQVEPRAAERLSKSYQMLVGVQMKGLADSRYWISGEGEATLTSPEEVTRLTLMISATLKEIIIRDRFTKATIKTITVPNE